MEDTRRFEKVNGETRIPTGTFDMQLRTVGGMHGRYASKFPEFHKGMLWLIGVPGFEWVYLHIGNDEGDTEGCLLVGDAPNNNTIADGFVGSSTNAYKRIYVPIAEAIESGEAVSITVKDIG